MRLLRVGLQEITWQLAVNTATSVITFLMVFVIQNIQNRDTLAIQIKLNELIRSLQSAHTSLVDVESMSLIERSQKFIEDMKLCQKKSVPTMAQKIKEPLRFNLIRLK